MQIPWRVSSVGSQEDCRVLKGSPCPQSQGKFQVSVCSLCAGIRVHRDSDVRLAAPQHQLQEEGAAAGARRGGGGAGGGAGAGGGPEAGAGKGARPPLRPPPRTIDPICGRCSRPTAPGVPFLPGSVSLSIARPLVGGGYHRVRPKTGWSYGSALVLRPLPFTYCRDA